MTSNNVYWNTVYPREIIKHLIAHGVEDFCIAPGSRSTPLVLALDSIEGINTHVHYDERGLGFFAMGLSIAKNRPVCVVVTSGTAVANLIPAVIESYYSRVPLVILSADRPSDLRNCEANQTIHQADLFGKHVHVSFDFPFASEELDFGFISTQISQMIHSALMNRGPVHLNIMFKEPFFGIMKESAIKTSYPPLQFSLPHLEANPSDIKTLSKKVGEKGLIIIGSDLDEMDLLAIAKLSHHLGYPVLPEIPSNFHLVESPFISHIELIMKGSLPHSLIPDHILFFGHRLISKTLSEWIKKTSLSTFVQIAPETSYYNPIHRLTHKFTCSIASFCNQLIHYKAENEELDFLSGWHTLSECYENAFTSYPKESVEWQFFREISHKIKGHPLFIANSMPIRFMNNFYNPKVQFGKTHVNRGTSGIDGNIGTSIGLCAGYQKPLVSLIGDQTALHDMNSLNLLKETKGHHLVIVNNSGGNIFSHLPIGKHKGPFEKFFFAGHGYSFKPLAEMFQIPYHPVYSLEELSLEGESSLTEIIVSAQEGNKSYETMLQKVISEVEDELSCLPTMG